MAKSGDRTRHCDAATRAGRLAKARQFMDAAHIIETLADEAGDIADAYVTLCVHAGIAAADVICCARLGRHASGDDHASAVALLERANPDVAKHVRALLNIKTKAGYTAIPVSGSEHTRAGRAARAPSPLGREEPGTAPDARDALSDPDTRRRSQAPDVLTGPIR